MAGGISVQWPMFSTDALMAYANNALAHLLTTSQYANNLLGQRTQQALAPLIQNYGQAQQQLQNSGNMANIYNAPYQQAGYSALDAYMDSLGLARPEMGSGASVNAAAQYANTYNNPEGMISQIANQYQPNPNQQLGLAALLNNYGAQ